MSFLANAEALSSGGVTTSVSARWDLPIAINASITNALELEQESGNAENKGDRGKEKDEDEMKGKEDSEEGEGSRGKETDNKEDQQATVGREDK